MCAHQKSKVLESRSGKLSREVDDSRAMTDQAPAADVIDADLLPETLGIADADGKIRASMRGKYDR